MVAHDDDEGSNAVVTYRLQDNKDERFEIDTVTGVVTSHGDFWPGNYSILTVMFRTPFRVVVNMIGYAHMDLHGFEVKTCLLSFKRVIISLYFNMLGLNTFFEDLCFSVEGV